MKKLAIITSHPIQYNAPLFSLLNERKNIDTKVFYTWGNEVLHQKFDPGFGKSIQWDIPLLEGYHYFFVKNIAKDKGSHHFKGINNPSLIAEIEAWHADAILVYGWNFKSHLKALRYFHNKVPVFFRGDSTSLIKNNYFRDLLRSVFLKWVYKNVDKALYVGANNKNYYLGLGLKEGQLVFAPHAIDNNRFLRNEAQCSQMVKEWKENLGIKREDIGFLYAGKLDGNKNIQILVEAFTSLSQKNIYLIIAGNGELENDLKQLAPDVTNIHFLPFQNQSMMPSLYRMADIFVLPSKSETWGLAINEAMACKRVLLVSDTCGAAKDLVKDGVNGFVFKSQSTPDLREKMLDCVGRKEGLPAMGEASLEIIKKWNYETDCEAIENLMRVTCKNSHLDK